MNDVPTLSPEGWVKDPAEKLNKLIMHAFAANESQSKIYHEEVTSIQAILSRTPNEIAETASALSEELKRYLERYFESAEVTVVDDTETDEARRTLRLDVIVRQDGKGYSLGATLSQSASSSTRYFLKILKG